MVLEDDRQIGTSQRRVEHRRELGRAAVGDEDARGAIAGDDVALARGIAADDVVPRAIDDLDPVTGVADDSRAAGIGADVVAGDLLPDTFCGNRP